METVVNASPVAPASPHVGSPRLAQAERFNLYSNPHKALRLCLGETVALAGRTDPQDEADVAALAAQVGAMLAFCRTHLDKEEQFVHAAMEARRPGSAAGTRAEHRDHLAAFERIESEIRAVEAAGARERERAVTKLYRHLALFAADNFVHMHAEETENNAVLWAHYSDQELQALEARLVAAIAPQVMQLAMRWMVPALNPSERATLLRAVREKAPAAAFDAIRAGAEKGLNPGERAKLAASLAK